MKVDRAVFADCLFLIGQAWIKRDGGNLAGAAEDLAAAAAMVPDGTVGLILAMIDEGDLPEPDPGHMDAWLEQCRLAGAGDFTVTFHQPQGTPPPVASAAIPALRTEPEVETEAEFQARLHRMVVDGTAAEEGRRALEHWRARGALARGTSDLDAQAS